MKRLLIILLASVLLVACGKKDVEETKEIDELDVETEEVTEEESVDEASESTDTEDENEVNSDSSQSKGKQSSKGKTQTQNKGSNKSDKGNKNESNQNQEAAKQESVDQVAKKVITSQNSGDYATLKKYLAKNVKLNEAKKELTISDVEYPGQVELISGMKKEDIEHRFTNDDDPKNVIVGYAAIDYEAEMSYTIEMTFIPDGNLWKLKNMQINK